MLLCDFVADGDAGLCSGIVCHTGAFYSLIVVNCIVLGVPKLLQLRIIRYLLCLMVLVWDLVSPLLDSAGAVREFLGTGKVLICYFTISPKVKEYGMLVFVLAPELSLHWDTLLH